MQIALPKKLADALGIKPPAANEEDPLFTWTANWVKTWENRRAEDMLVLVNNANRFTVAIYQVKRKDLKDIDEIIKAAISNTLLSINVSLEIIEEYMQKAGEIEFVKNSNRKATSWVNRSGQESSSYVADTFNGIDEMFNDIIGTSINDYLVSDPKNPKDYIVPSKEMIQALSELSRWSWLK